MSETSVVISLIVMLVGVIGFSVIRSQQAAKEREERKRQRREYLYRKYGSAVGEKLYNRTVWTGETPGQLVDSLGEPSDIDQKVLKTKKKEVWKYFPTGVNRYGLRITIENGEVIGWDEKM